MAFTKISLVLFLCLLCLYSVTAKSQTGGESVSSIVTQQFFDNIIKEGGSGCAGKRFYTRDSFINAANTFSKFGDSVTKREIATMFAHFTHETGHFCYVGEIKRRPYCESPVEQTDCIPLPDCDHPRQKNCYPPVKGYFGLEQRLNLDLLRQHELVGSSNPTVGFKKSLRFWMNSVRPILNQGFGATIRAINGTECNGENSDAVNERIRYYRDYCGQLGVDPGSNLSC